MYEAFYRLNAKPFSLNPDPAFFFGSKCHKRAMSYLEYGLHQGEGFIVITGEVGAGKTTLVRNLFRSMDTGVVVAAQLVSTQLDADDTLKMVAASFGVPFEDSKAAILKRLEAFLYSCREQGKRVLLVVDEAQNLAARSVEELRMLSNFQSSDRALLQVFLLGQPEFRVTMQGPGMAQLRQRVIASYHLGPLDAEDTKGYIEHRLKTAGWTGDPAFDAEAFTAIHTFSSGIPRRINTLCDRLLLMGYLEEKHAFAAEEVQEVIADLQRELTYPEGALAANTQPAFQFAAQTLSADAEVKLAKLEERVADVERSVTTVLKLLREVLSLASVRRLRSDDRP